MNAVNQSLAELKAGSLCFWGDWFGKPYDNQHRITGAMAVDEYDVIYFNEGETLRLEGPQNWSLNGGRLLIRDAISVRFQWFYYGRLPGPDSLRFIEYRRVGGAIEVSADFIPGQIAPTVNPSKPAVELHV